MQSFDFKKLLPHALIVGLFALISLVYCYPALQGKELLQSDIISWKASSHEADEWYKKTGENTLWSNSMFGGMPTYTFYVPKSHNYITYINDVVKAVLPKPAFFFFLAMLSFYIMMCSLRVNRWLGFIGAFAFAFSTYNIILVAFGHDSKMLTMVFMPLIISGMLITYRGNYFFGGIFLCLSFALLVVASHLQVIYYMAIVIALAVIGFFLKALKEKQLKRFFIASFITLFAFIIGTGPGMSNLLTVQEYSKYTMRGGQSELTFNHDKDKAKKGGGLDKEYAFRWSNGIGETFCFMIPYLYGGSSSEPVEMAPQAGEIMSSAGYSSVPLYWGPQDLGISGPVYFGAIICFLFVLSLMVVRSPHKWWIVAACVFTIILSWGKNFAAVNYFLFDNLPFYNKFRTPTIALVVPEFLFPMLGIWGLMEIINGKVSREELLKKLKIALGITVGLCLLLGFGGSMFFDFTNPVAEAEYPQQLIAALKEDRASLATESALKSAIYIALAGGLIWAFLKDKIKANILVIGIGALVAVDLLSVATHYLNSENYQEPADFEQVFQPRPVDQQVLQDKDPYYRVLDLTRSTYNDAIQCYFHKCIGGYSPAKLEIYQDLIDVHMSRQFNAQVLNMLNTKYIIFNNNNTPVAQVNKDANGNAWFVEEIKWAQNADEEILSMNAPALGDTTQIANPFDSKKTAVVREHFRKELGGFSFGKDSNAKVVLTKYGLNDLSFQSSNSKDGFAVFSDIYYEKGWEAYIDGKQVPILRANYVLRALRVPAGEHKIEFHFRPKTYEIGENIAMISSLLIYGLIITAIIMLVKGKNPTPNVED